ncbi:gamma-glutamyltransferase, partial [Desulfovibrio sp. OttesenSCG-928-M16]|nr:gamma-glutamyltransferase [Desulfovibrio sp. OttesenSCG-928-M16]
MLFTARAYNGMVVTPHRLASEAGITILRKGGNAVEAAVAAAAALCVVYPHMTGLGGDAVWLVLPAAEAEEGGHPFVIDACGRSAGLACETWYTERGHNHIPTRGPAAAMTLAGAVSGWQAALEAAATWQNQGNSLSLGELFEDAIKLAEDGFPLSTGQSTITFDVLHELSNYPGFARTFLLHGKSPGKGRRLRLPALAHTLSRLAAEGLDSFYRGALAKEMATDLEQAGSPLRIADFEKHKALLRSALSTNCFGATLYNSPPPTQGVASLMILALVERLTTNARCNLHDETSLIHATVEATKEAFALRNRFLADPEYMEREAESLLDPALLDKLAGKMSPDMAKSWPYTGSAGGDTVWLGVMDRMGNSVSVIQSIYHEFGSGLVLPRSGVLWHNRGLGFVFEKGHANSLAPNK